MEMRSSWKRCARPTPPTSGRAPRDELDFRGPDPCLGISDLEQGHIKQGLVAFEVPEDTDRFEIGVSRPGEDRLTWVVARYEGVSEMLMIIRVVGLIALLVAVSAPATTAQERPSTPPTWKRPAGRTPATK